MPACVLILVAFVLFEMWRAGAPPEGCHIFFDRLEILRAKDLLPFVLYSDVDSSISGDLTIGSTLEKRVWCATSAKTTQLKKI